MSRDSGTKRPVEELQPDASPEIYAWTLGLVVRRLESVCQAVYQYEFRSNHVPLHKAWQTAIPTHALRPSKLLTVHPRDTRQVADFLKSLSLERWLPLFCDTDGATLSQLSENDLKEIGCSELLPRRLGYR